MAGLLCIDVCLRGCRVKSGCAGRQKVYVKKYARNKNQIRMPLPIDNDKRKRFLSLPVI